MKENRVGLSHLLHGTDSIAIRDSSEPKKILSHRQLKHFISATFVPELLSFHIKFGSRVGIVLPNGPELAVCLLATLSNWCAIPLSQAYNTLELENELRQTKAEALIYFADNHSARNAAESLCLPKIVLTSRTDLCGLFNLKFDGTLPVAAASDVDSEANNFKYLPRFSRLCVDEVAFPDINHFPSRQEIVLILLTSGTAGTKKVVPYSLDMVVEGVNCVIKSWNLSQSDLCLNMMPLYHIGGIMRNVLAPILAGMCFQFYCISLQHFCMIFRRGGLSLFPFRSGVLLGPDGRSSGHLVLRLAHDAPRHTSGEHSIYTFTVSENYG